jgi:arsenate reductase
VALLSERGIDFDAVEYLKHPPNRATLERIVGMLDAPGELVRKDSRFKELGLDAARYTTPETVVALLLEHPELMQRPIVICGERAVIARPPDKLLALL